MNHLKQGFNDGHIKCYFKHQVPYINHMYETITFIMCENVFPSEETTFSVLMFRQIFVIESDYE